MKQPQLAIRVDPRNPDHHLWNNHGTWWCHLTLHLPDFTKRRLRFSLGTADVQRARALRNRVLAAGDPGQIGGLAAAQGGLP